MRERVADVPTTHSLIFPIFNVHYLLFTLMKICFPGKEEVGTVNVVENPSALSVVAVAIRTFLKIHC
ncbi:MAG: hypothetical protein ABI406_10500 [Ktedonobacteraceae bacterium]